MTVNSSTTGLPAGVLPIHVGNGEEAARRREAGAVGQNLTVQHIEGTQAVSQPVINPAIAAAAAAMQMDVPVQPQVAPVQPAPVPVELDRYDDKTTSAPIVVAGLTVALTIETTQEIVYTQKLLPDWAAINEQVMFVFITADRTMIGATDKPAWNDELNDWEMKTGSFMKFGTVQAGVKVSHELTLTEREDVVVEPVNELIPVNPVEQVKTEAEQPYYALWGAKRRNKLRNQLRAQGKPVPADL